MTWLARNVALTSATVFGVVGVMAAGAAETVYPVVDGNLLDGGTNGPFDGNAEFADWTFDQSGYESWISLSTVSSVEQRMVWEYDLTPLTLGAPVSAKLTFTLRAVDIFPFPNVDVHVYAYPADLLETWDGVLGAWTDFSAAPVALQGSVTVVPFSGSLEHSLNVSAAVNAVLDVTDKVAFRFQVDPGTAEPDSQVFLDALDADPATKPYLTIIAQVPGDCDVDGDVDMDDFAGFEGCLAGPAQGLVAPSCTCFDRDGDGHIDLADFAAFQKDLAGQ